MSRFKDIEWNLPTVANGRIAHWDAMKVAALMDIRDELKKLNALLYCKNFIDIPRKLDAIKRSIAKPRKKRAAKP